MAEATRSSAGESQVYLQYIGGTGANKMRWGSFIPGSVNTEGLNLDDQEIIALATNAEPAGAIVAQPRHVPFEELWLTHAPLERFAGSQEVGNDAKHHEKRTPSHVRHQSSMVRTVWSYHDHSQTPHSWTCVSSCETLLDVAQIGCAIRAQLHESDGETDPC
eukprot:5912334-Amphidinium_carterae.1